MEKDRIALEYDKILQRLSEFAVSESGRGLCLELCPFSSRSEAELALRQTDRATQLLQRYGAPSLGSLRNVGSSCRRASGGAVLSIRELLDIADTLRTIEQLHGYLEAHAAEEDDVFHEAFLRLMPNRYLSQKLSDAFVGEEEVADSASPQLRDIRRKMTAARDRVRTALDNILRTHARFLQDSLITLRGGRYVIPVKAEHRGEIAGLVHDTSASGATLFIEPMAVVQANNDLTVLQAKEHAEIERILAALSAEVGDFCENILNGFEICRFFDFTFAKARYALDLRASLPLLNEEGIVDLRGARHPLIPYASCVPIDLKLGTDYDALIVTGPNTGGKTVSLKTTGILCLMAESGLFIPAKENSRVAFFDRVFADIGDDQSIEQSLSTFSAHMKNIISILREVTDRSLVLLDELGSGTDPIEGAALAIAVIEALRNRGVRLVATTHYAELKLYALQTSGVENASCEFDVATLRPTYRLLVGIPGRSNAFAIAHRLGMPDDVIEDARNRIDSENVRMENVLADMEIRRRSAEMETERAQRLREEAAEKLRAAEDARKDAENKVTDELNNARRQAYEILEKARREARQTLDGLEELRKQKDRADFRERIGQGRAEMNKRIDTAQVGLDVREKRKAKPVEGPLRRGDDVYVVSLDKEGVVLEEPEKGKDSVLVQIGIMKTRVRLSDLERSETKKKVTFRPSSSGVSGVARGSRRVSPELDIRGMTAMEADGRIDEYLDNCAMAGLHSVSIIHGKGTGALRAAVQDKLRGHPQVDTFRSGVFGEGDTGVTVVTLK